MTDTERWLAEYDDNHSRTGNRVLHWIAVPLFIFGTVGLLWALPIPDAFLKISPHAALRRRDRRTYRIAEHCCHLPSLVFHRNTHTRHDRVVSRQGVAS